MIGQGTLVKFWLEVVARNCVDFLVLCNDLFEQCRHDVVLDNPIEHPQMAQQVPLLRLAVMTTSGRLFHESVFALELGPLL